MKKTFYKEKMISLKERKMTDSNHDEIQKRTLRQIEAGVDFPWLPDTRRGAVAESLRIDIKKRETATGPRVKALTP